MRSTHGHRSGMLATAALVASIATTSAQDAARIFPFPVSVFELDNGLRVVGVDYDSPGIVAYYTVVRTGSRNEVEPGFSGYAHFFEHMMFRGTEKYSTDAYGAVVKRIGADANAFTTSDWTTYYIVASADALETMMDLESDRFRHLQYSEEDFKTEAGAILGEYNLNFSNPVSLLREKLHDLAYTTHPYKHTTIGLLDDIQEMPNHYDYSLEFYDRYYRPEKLHRRCGGRFRPGGARAAGTRVLRRVGTRRLHARHSDGAAPDRGADGARHLAESDAAVLDDRLSRARVF